MFALSSLARTAATVVPFLSCSILLAGAASAQVLYGWDGAAVVMEHTGPPSAAFCGYPSGPIVSTFPLPPSVCPTVAPIGPPIPGLPGGAAYDPVLDQLFISDGGLVEVVTTGGAFVDSFVMPMPVFGLGYDAAAGLLWSTDGGALVYAVAPPILPACGGPVPFAVPPFPVPAPGPPLSGIDWDPAAGVLWIADVAGMVQNIFPGGAPGPFGPPYPVAPGPCFPPVVPILRVAVDRGSPFGPGHLYVSDGFMVASVLPGGGPAPPTFAFPGAPPGAPCFPTPLPQTGMAFAAHGIPFGAGLDPDGLAAPVIGTTGASTTPNPAFTHTLTSAVPGGFAVLAVGFGASCPTVPVLGVPAHLSFAAPILTLGTAFVPLGGAVALPTPIPPGVAPGITGYSQWAIGKPLGPSPLQVSGGLSFRISLP